MERHDPLRCRESLVALRARWHAELAARRERDALAKLGAALSAAGPPRSSAGERLHDAHVTAERLDERVDGLRTALAASLQEDQADYADASSWLRPVVVLRGIATRLLVRDRLGRALKARVAAWRALGGAALDEGVAAPTSAAPAAAAALEARARSARATAALDSHLAALRGARVPVIACHVGREAIAFGKPFLREVRGRLLPRVPALAGLAVGWWIASTFTDSRLSATLHALGIGSGPRRVVSTQHLRAMEFWLPIAAAALCSYASGRIAALVRSRYAPATDEQAPEPPRRVV